MTGFSFFNGIPTGIAFACRTGMTGVPDTLCVGGKIFRKSLALPVLFHALTGTDILLGRLSNRISRQDNRDVDDRVIVTFYSRVA